jgi:hypothetical protein
MATAEALPPQSPTHSAPPASPMHSLAVPLKIAVTILAWLLLLLALGAVAMGIRFGSSSISGIAFGFVLAGILALFGHGLLISTEPMVYRLTRKRWVELPEEIVHRHGPRLERLRRYLVLDMLMLFGGTLVIIVAREGGPTINKLTVVIILLFLIVAIVYNAARSHAPEIAMNKNGLRLVGMPGYNGRVIPWRDIKTVSSTRFTANRVRTYYLVLDIAAPEQFGLKPLGAPTAFLLHARGNVAIGLRGYPETPRNIIADVLAFHARYAKAAQAAAAE